MIRVCYNHGRFGFLYVVTIETLNTLIWLNQNKCTFYKIPGWNTPVIVWSDEMYITIDQMQLIINYSHDISRRKANIKDDLQNHVQISQDLWLAWNLVCEDSSYVFISLDHSDPWHNHMGCLSQPYILVSAQWIGTFIPLILSTEFGDISVRSKWKSTKLMNDTV